MRGLEKFFVGEDVLAKIAVQQRPHFTKLLYSSKDNSWLLVLPRVLGHLAHMMWKLNEL